MAEYDFHSDGIPMTDSETIVQAPSTDATEPGVPGKYVIMGIFGLAVVMTGSLWIYWDFHTAPFRPLQIAIAEHFPKSEPRVQGGQRKIHKETPFILRIVMRVKFNPLLPKNKQQIGDMSSLLFALAGKHQELETYDTFELHFFKMKPEKMADQITLSLDMKELLQSSEDERANAISTAIQSAQEPKSP